MRSRRACVSLLLLLLLLFSDLSHVRVRVCLTSVCASRPSVRLSVVSLSGVMPGDLILALDGKPIRAVSELVSAVQRNGQRIMTLSVVRQFQPIPPEALQQHTEHVATSFNKGFRGALVQLRSRQAAMQLYGTPNGLHE